MGHTKNRLVEIMGTVAGVKLTINEAVEKGTTIDILDVSPETIEIGQDLPSLSQKDMSIRVSRPNEIVWWKKEFIEKYGRKAQLVFGKELPRQWSVVGNRDFEIWQKGSLSAKQNWLDMDRAGGNNFGLD